MSEQKLLCEGLNESAQIIHQNNVGKGFYDEPKKMVEILCLIHSEVSEAVEADRKDNYVLGSIDMPSMNTILDNQLFEDTYDIHVKGTLEEEAADIIIRVLDMCGYKGIDIEEHIRAKVRYNKLRAYKHGKKY